MTAPRYLHFQLTERCNLACPGCYLPERAGRGADPADIEDTVFAPLAREGVRLATLTGGEPLLHPRWREVCAAAVRHFENVQLVCNGMLLDLPAYEALAQAGVHAVKVSLDGPGPAVHDALRGQAGCFERVAANLRAIAGLPPGLRGGVNLGVICTVSPRNVGLLGETAALAQDMGLDSLLFQPYHPFGMLYPPEGPPHGPVNTDKAYLETLTAQVEELKALRRARPGFLDNSLHMLERFLEFHTAPLGPEQVCGADRFVFVNSAFEARGCLFCKPLGSLRGQTLPALLASGPWQGFYAFRRSCRRCLMGCQFVDPAQDLAEEGFARLDAKDLDGARERFDASLALEYSVGAAHGAGAARLQEERPHEARRLLEEALAHQPRNPLIMADLGWAHLKLDEMDAARARFDASLALSYTPVAGHGAGLARFRQGDAAGALPFLEEALAHRPDNTFILQDLGFVLIRLERWDALEGVCARLFTVAPGNATPYRLRGLAARRKGELEAALPDLRAAMEACEPHDPWPVFEYGLTCLETGRFEEAARAIALAVQRDPAFPWFRYRLAMALTGLGMRAEALEACREALRLDPGPEAFHALLHSLETGEAHP